MLSLLSSQLALPTIAEQKGQFEAFKVTYNKTYSAKEEPLRFSAFVKNLEIIEARNK